MKCPKCGSELDTGFNCPKCKAKSYKEIVSEYNTNGEKIYEKNTIKLVQPEPTTAEMLLWLVGKSNEGVFSIIQARDVIMLNFVIGKNHNFVIGKNHINAREETLTETIKQAYDWAKQEEQNAKN